MSKIKISALAATVFLAGSLTLEAAWTAKRLTNQDSSKYPPKIAGSSSNVYVIWTEDPDPSSLPLYFRRSTDNGTTWKTAKVLTGTDEWAFNPAIAAYGPNVYVVWESGSGIAFKRSTDSGATWKTTVQLPATMSLRKNPDIAVSGQYVYVVWNQWDGDEWGSEEVYFVRSLDGGATWKTPKNITAEVYLEDDAYPAVAASGEYVYVAWERDQYTPEVIFRRSVDFGSHWKPVVNLSNTPSADSRTPDVAAMGARVHVVWDEEINYQGIYYAHSSNYGATWPTASKITTASARPAEPAIAAKSSDVDVAFEEWAVSDAEINLYRSTQYGSSFSLTRLTQNSGSSSYPDVAVSYTHIYVVWVDNSTGRDEIYIKYSPRE